jgi:hypothetical protein
VWLRFFHRDWSSAAWTFCGERHEMKETHSLCYLNTIYTILCFLFLLRSLFLSHPNKQKKKAQIDPSDDVYWSSHNTNLHYFLLHKKITYFVYKN